MTFTRSIPAQGATLVLLALSAVGSTHATEGGTSMYPNGIENHMSGALPPPGLYGIVYGNHYKATQVNDNSGNSLNIPGFKVEADVLAARLIWLPGTKVLGGDLVLHTILPVVNLSVNVPGASQTKTGIGDAVVGAGIGFHHSPNLHSVVAVDVFLPTGSYDKADLANIGKNHWGFEPVYAVTLKHLSADAKRAAADLPETQLDAVPPKKLRALLKALAALAPLAACSGSPSTSAAPSKVRNGCTSCTWLTRSAPPRARPRYQAKKPAHMENTPT